jgi:Raf kinase inhibitor-like YbhB/YbcL family protein
MNKFGAEFNGKRAVGCTRRIRASADAALRFEQQHVGPAIVQSAGGCQARSTCSNDDNIPGYTARMNVHSSSFSNGATIPQKHVFDDMGCTGENISPQLSWDGVPAGAKSFAVVMHDPDAPTSGGFYHWVMFNIPAGKRGLDEGEECGTLGHTDFGKNEYGGPCPPPGAPHHYHITVYALDTEKLPLDKTTTGAKLEFMASQHTLEKAEIVGLYGR